MSAGELVLCVMSSNRHSFLVLDGGRLLLTLRQVSRRVRAATPSLFTMPKLSYFDAISASSSYGLDFCMAAYKLWPFYQMNDVFVSLCLTQLQKDVLRAWLSDKRLQLLFRKTRLVAYMVFRNDDNIEKNKKREYAKCGGDLDVV